MKPIKLLIMSVGSYDKNTTAKWAKKLGGLKNIVVVLPKQFEKFKKTYTDQGIEVYVYDEQKYINEDFEYFGFKPRNCGGVGRQGIAEATEHYKSDDCIFLELDDDTGTILARAERLGEGKTAAIRSWDDLERIYNTLYKFYESCGILMGGRTLVAVPGFGEFLSSYKLFNNFLMIPGNDCNFWGFKAFVSDDVRFDFYNAMYNHICMCSCTNVAVGLPSSQGERDDGNAPIYNGDYSWKKSFSLKMSFPWVTSMRYMHEGRDGHPLFRENVEMAQVYPKISLADETGKVVSVVR